MSPEIADLTSGSPIGAFAGGAEFGPAAVSLEALIHHREWVDHDSTLESVQQIFRAGDLEFLPVVREGKVIGLCSRGQVGFSMGSRFGFAIYSKDLISTLMVPRPLIIRRDSPLREVLGRALVRHGEEFIEDVALVEENGALLGLIKVEALAHLQSRLVTEQVDALHRQHEVLRSRNLDLFKANHAARQSHGLYLGLLASHTLGVGLLDPDGTVHEHNSRLSGLLGFGDPAGPRPWLPGWVSDAEREEFRQVLSDLATAEEPVHREFAFEVPKLGARAIRCSLGWIPETSQICACLDDVTEQRSMERSLLRQEKQRLLDTLVGGIAHELNNKLAPILGFSELLQLEASEGASRHIDLIVKSVEEAARIIRQLLELSKPSSGAAAAAPFDLRTVVDETLAILRFQLRESRCRVDLVVPPVPVLVLGDAGQMKQVALNIVINALHAMEGRDDPVLSVEVRGTGLAGEFVVSDNGCGIAPENLGRIFDPFFTTKGPVRGTGLGLSVCFSIVRQHGGDIRVESKVGAGTRFTVSLRREQSVTLEPEVVRPATAVPVAMARTGTKVLIVEDEIVLRRLLHEILSSRFGCTVETASNGQEALEALGREKFSMILADIRMPVMTGTELYARLRESHPEMSDRFLFVTGHPGEKELEAQIARWNVPIVKKPFSLARLAEACGPILERAARQVP